MSVTVVIPTRGVSADLRSSVEFAIRSASLTGPGAEVLVVVNGRGDAPALSHLDSPALRVLYLETANVARARNVGIAEARNDTILFGDDGAFCEDSWATDLGTALRDPLYPVVTAPVRVPVTGAVTAFLNYQRSFDAPPVNEVEAQTVTGNCGIRRDLLPATVRYDEDNLPLVAEDVAFGQSVRAAGLKIRWLADAPPGMHLLSDRVEEVTDRLIRYGRGAALVWSRRNGAVARPADILALYRHISAEDYRVYRRFNEILAPSGRAAFTVYDYLFDLAFVIGYLSELGVELGHTFIDYEPEGLRTAWRDIAARATIDASHLSTSDWTGLPVDYALLDSVATTRDPLVADIKRSLAVYAPLRSSASTDAPASPQPEGASDPQPDLALLHEAWRELRALGQPIKANDVDSRARALGFSFRDACGSIERTARWSAGRAARAQRSNEEQKSKEEVGHA